MRKTLLILAIPVIAVASVALVPPGLLLPLIILLAWPLLVLWHRESDTRGIQQLEDYINLAKIDRDNIS